MRRLTLAPVPARMNATRVSLSARASRTNLSYFSYTTGMKSMKTESTMPATDTNTANPVNPARRRPVNASPQTKLWRRTWSDFPVRLEARNTREAGHGEEVEEDLTNVKQNRGL